MNRGTIRTTIKTLVGRNFTGIDDVLNPLIDSAVELFGSTITNIYDEAEWEHQITQEDVNSKTDNFALPVKTKYILKASIINKTGSEPVYYPLTGVSPMDWYDLNSLSRQGQFSDRPTEDYSTSITFGGLKLRGWRAGRVDYAGIPRFYTRIGNNIYLYPRPGNNEVGYVLRVMLAVKPAVLATDTDTNVITDNYPDALIYYVGALLWLLHLNDQVRGAQWLQTASLYLQHFATEEEIKRLIGMTVKLS